LHVMLRMRITVIGSIRASFVPVGGRQIEPYHILAKVQALLLTGGKVSQEAEVWLRPRCAVMNSGFVT